MPLETFDAIVLGAGPAGATVALNLAPFRRVLLLDRHARVTPRIGESLPAAAGRLLRDMRLWAEFAAGGHLPCHVRRSIWGGPEPVETDALLDLDGPGWSLDRVGFEAMLRVSAIARGTVFRAPAKAGSITRWGCGWRVGFLDSCESQTVHARLLIDARGRSARPPRGLMAERLVCDRLVCGWVAYRDARPSPLGSLLATEAEPDGWWYGVHVPGNRRVLAFHTDADLPAAADAREPAALLARAARLSPDLAPPRDLLAPTGGFCAAHSCHLVPSARCNWLAVGDAALAFDPLSSQGLLNALYTGLCAAEAADRLLAGEEDAILDYEQSVNSLWRAYRRHLPSWYAQELRWRDRPFWARRVDGRPH